MVAPSLLIGPVPALANGETWTSSPVPEKSWMSVATDGEGVWVAVAYGGELMRSTDDAETWETVSEPAAPAAADTNQLWSVATDGTGRWLAIRDTDSDDSLSELLVSTDDGATWTLSSTPPPRDYRAIAYGDGVWIAVSSNGGSSSTRIARSDDGGATWTTPTAPSGQWQSVATDGEGVWVAVAYFTDSRSIIRSTDGGQKWEQVEGPGSRLGLKRLLGVASDGDGTWVAVGEYGTDNIIRSTDDGATWGNVTSGGTGSFSISAVAHGGDVWVAVASDAPTSSRVLRSTDGGANWTAVTRVDGEPRENGWESVAYGNGVWAAVADSGTNRLMVSGEPLPEPAPTSGSAPSTPVLDAGAFPAVAPGDAVWRTPAGERVPLAVSAPAPGQVRYADEGVTVTLTGAGTGAGGGLVVDPTVGIDCEICAPMAPGSVIEVWMFSSPRLVAAHRVGDEACHRFTIPVGAPLDGGGALAVGPHTLQLAMPSAGGMAAIDVGVSVGGPVPASVPAGEGPGPSGATPLLLAFLAILAGLAVTVRAGRTSAPSGAVGSEA